MTQHQACQRCGATLATTKELSGLCPACVLKASIEPEVVVTGGSPRRPAPDVAALSPHFPDLEIQSLLGQGGMGAVYRVRQKSLGRDAALKVLSLDADADPAFGERFSREAQLLASLDHPNIVAVYGAGKAGPFWFLLMELVEGASLRQLIAARELDPRSALSIVGQICDALQAAHDRGVVHRDIKPENVIVTRKGAAKILDFGLAKLVGQGPRTGHTLTETGQVMGTVRYMAPEQWERPLSVDHRADIYSLGVVLYELLTNELPMGRFPLPSQKAAVSSNVDQIVLKSLEKEPAQRYQHASDVRADVTRAAAAAPSTGIPKPAVAGTSALRTFGILAIVALLALGMAIYATCLGTAAAGALGLYELIAASLVATFLFVAPAVVLWFLLKRPWPKAIWARATVLFAPPFLFAALAILVYEASRMNERGRIPMLGGAQDFSTHLDQFNDSEFPFVSDGELATFATDPEDVGRGDYVVSIRVGEIETLTGFERALLARADELQPGEITAQELKLASQLGAHHFALLSPDRIEERSVAGDDVSYTLPKMDAALALHERIGKYLLLPENSEQNGSSLAFETDENEGRIFSAGTYLRTSDMLYASFDMSTVEKDLTWSSAEQAAAERLMKLRKTLQLDSWLEYGREPLKVTVRGVNSSQPSASVQRADGSTVHELTASDLQGRYAILLHLAEAD